MPLQDFEVALIKTMLERGMPNKNIQFYFNTPQRPVNNGRISEIKSGARWSEIPPATLYELSEFIENHPLTQADRTPEEPRLPSQTGAASVFTVLDNELVDVVSDPPVNEISNSDQLVLFEELVAKVEALWALGDNGLGAAKPPVERFRTTIQQNFEKISIVTIWTRGNALRATLKAHDTVAENHDNPLGRLEPLCAEHLRDVVAIFNVLIANDPKGSQLDQTSLGPGERTSYTEALGEIAAVIEHSDDITTGEAYSQLNEQTENGLANHSGIEGDQALKVSVGSVANFLLTLLKRSLHAIREATKEDFLEILKKARQAGYAYGFASIVAAWPPAMKFIAENAPPIHAFLEKITVNETILGVLKFVSGLIVG